MVSREKIQSIVEIRIQEIIHEWDFILGLGPRMMGMERNMDIIGLKVSKSLIIPAVYSFVSTLVLVSFLVSCKLYQKMEPNKVKFVRL